MSELCVLSKYKKWGWSGYGERRTDNGKRTIKNGEIPFSVVRFPFFDQM